VPPHPGCPRQGPPSSEVTEAICRVPSAPFSQAPGYALPVHLCRFRVRSISWGYFLEHLRGMANPVRPHNLRYSSHPSRPTNINVVPITYGFRPRLRGRLTLRGLALRRNPWTFGESVSHTLYRYSCQHSHLPYLHGPSRVPLHRPRQRSATAYCKNNTPAASVHVLSPVTSSARDGLFRPVSCYAFFKGWLLLSQPPGCYGLLTSFPT